MIQVGEKDIRDIINKELKLSKDINDFELDSPLNEYGLNSISLIKLVLALEKHYNCKIKADNLDLDYFMTIANIIKLLKTIV